MHCANKSDDDICILQKNAFFNVKLNILHKWLNILRKFYVTMFTPDHLLLRRSIPLQLPGSPPDHPGLPTWPAAWPCLPPESGGTGSRHYAAATKLIKALRSPPSTRHCPPTHPASHPTVPNQPATPPSCPAFVTALPSSSATTAS